MDYYTVLLMLKPGLLIANQIKGILPFGQALQSSLLLPGAVL